MPPIVRRLADLLIDPHETLEVEHKEWIDIVGNNDHKAILAKALIALANHGGGFVILGLSQTQQGVVAAPNRPPDLTGYTPDTVNSIVNAYAEPTFHCDLNVVERPDGQSYPVVSVPGGHRVPIKAKRDGPNGQTVKQNTYYVRRPGPQSEGPQNGREWDVKCARSAH
jgi:predicted HTH transcriptional regulator